MTKIKLVIAREIKDSRGNPTIEVELETNKGSFVASVPSGASTGKNEALELRDSSPTNFGLGGKEQKSDLNLKLVGNKDGKGVSNAIFNVNKIIAPKLKNRDVTEQVKIDEFLIELDGTENKSKLGANAISAVSMTVCRAGAGAKKIPLYRHISELSFSHIYAPMRESEKKGVGLPLFIPLPMFNILEGGAHVHPQTKRDDMVDENTEKYGSRSDVGASNDLDIQEFMVVPQKKTFAENLITGSKIFQNLKEILVKNYGEKGTIMGDEGGFAPPISSTQQALYLLKSAIGENNDVNPVRGQGDLTGKIKKQTSNGVKIAIDCAASQFYKNGKYLLEGKELTRFGLLDFYKDLAQRFPIIFIEDPFAEEDWEGFRQITKELSSKISIIGDDLTTTNIKRIKEAHNKSACNGIILKLNQIGTVSETIEAAKLAKSFGWKTIVSHRSGETLDNFIADLAVGVGSDFIKSGSPTKEERMVKYNRLLQIESELIVKH